MQKRVLLVEDEPSIRDSVRINLEIENLEVVTADRGDLAIQLVQEQHFDLIILDIMLPEMDGYTVCQAIRLEQEHVPIIFVTAKDTSADRIHGLRIGADDYLTKPFHLEELLLRVHNLLKRSLTPLDPNRSGYQFGPNRINFVTFEAMSLQGPLTLTKKEVQLMKLLIDQRNKVVSRQQMLQLVWGYDIFPSTRTVDNFILALRKYFEEDPKNPKYIRSVRGVGYKFVND
ncbi:MAG TPA: response regulator transcription factor [Saprospiraceae bacterium]|nr:response regulator transcription factor [Saprospiraceae bacterium]MCB9269155.1 response regulator transcription factor [Lewinellaceae bacterium]HPG05420.1 response regulator transcription factor [Saprospiraceae bacterium]HPR00095.1 response regulator transcription factor [Saprospiraceae bacterium]HQU55245.1 response regulator transcription factor [Saprospiraceae bacterium]